MATDIQRIMGHYDVDEATARQALALAPASALLPKAGSNPGVLNWMLLGGTSFFFGAILGPAIWGASEAGAMRLKEIAEKKIRGG